MGNSNILAITADGTSTEVVDPGPVAWKDGDNLPHLVYTDPPGGMTAEVYELALKDTAREATKIFTADGEAEKQFTAALTYGLGEDLVVAHGVPVDAAIAAVIKFAAQVWAEVYPPVANTAETVTP